MQKDLHLGGAAGSHQLAAQARGDTAAKRARKRTTWPCTSIKQTTEPAV